MQVEVSREAVSFQPIRVSFLVQDSETLRKIHTDLRNLGAGAYGASYEDTDAICKEIAEQLRPFVEA